VGIFGASPDVGKKRECVVVDAASIEPVSSLQFREMQGDFRKMQGGGNRGLAKSHQISIAWNGVSLLKRAGRSREAIVSKQGGCRDPQSRRKDPAGHQELSW